MNGVQVAAIKALAICCSTDSYWAETAKHFRNNALIVRMVIVTFNLVAELKALAGPSFAN